MPEQKTPDTLISLQSCLKQYTFDQDKACSPTETVNRFLMRLKQVNLDILKEIKRIDTGRLEIPVYFSVCGADAQAVIGNKKQMGKGSTPEQARASACMELAERFSFFSFLQNPANYLYGDYAQMEHDGFPVMSMETLLQSVHDTSHSTELLRELLQDIPMQWVWALNLSDDKPVLVPFSWFYAINEFNGPAAGNTYEEAALQGICEIVERHVCAIIAREEMPVPQIALESITDPVARGLLNKFAAQGIELRLFDFSLNTGIPTIGALAWDPSTFPDKSEIVYTAGTTPGVNKAIIRAITEVAQLAGDFNSASNYVASGLPKPLVLDEVAYLLDSPLCRSVSEINDLQSADIYKEIQNCVQRLKETGLDVCLVNTKHPQLQIPALYTIVPGAHFRERAMGGNAVLFAAKLASSLLEGAAREDKFTTMQALVPEDYSLFFYRGQQAYESGDFAAAHTFFAQALALPCPAEDKPYLYSYLASCLRDLGRYEEAMDALRAGFSYDEARPDMHNIMGVCLYHLGRYQEAVIHFKRAVELNPVSAIDYANMALNLEYSGDFKAARLNYEVALSLDSSITFAAEHLAVLTAMQEKE